MRALLLILLVSPCFAGGPKYSHKDPLVNDEFAQVYHDIRSVLSGDVRISSVTISTLTVSSSYVPGITLGKFKQVVTSNTVTGFSTAGSSYADTYLGVTITPASASSTILLMATATSDQNTNNGIGYFTFRRNAVELTSGGSMAQVKNFGTRAYTPTTLLWIDSPATTSATTYRVQTKTNGTGTVTWGEGESEYMIAVEIGN